MTPERRRFLQRLGLGLLAFSALLIFKPLEDAYSLPQRLGLSSAALLLALAAPARWPAGPVAWTALGWMTWRLFCRAWAQPPGSALLWAAEQIPLAVILVFAAAALMEARLRRHLAAALLTALALVSLLALAPRLGLKSAGDGAVDLGFGRRLYGTLGNPDFLGGWLALLLPLGLVLAWRSSGLQRRWAAFAFALGALALFLTEARASWLAGVLGCALAWMALQRPAWRRVAAVGALALLALAAAYGQRERLPPRLADAFNAQGESWQSRAFMGSVAVDLANAHPVFGVGPGGFGNAFLQRQGKRLSAGERQPWRLTFDAHNDWLQNAAESGWPGFLLWVLAFGLACRAAWRRGGVEGAALLGGLGAFGVQGLFHFPWAIVPSAGLAVLGFGLAAGFEPGERRPLSPAAAWIAVGLLVASQSLLWRQAFASAQLNSGVAAGLSPATRGLSVVLLSKAAALAPQDARPWSRLAAEQLRLGQPEAAIQSLQGALDALPASPEAWTQLCLALGQQGSLDAADQACAQALALRPGLAEAWVNWSKVAWLGGRAELAEQRLRQGLEKAGPSAQASFNLGAVLYNGGRFKEAAQAFEAVVALEPQHAEAQRLLKECRRAR